MKWGDELLYKEVINLYNLLFSFRFFFSNIDEYFAYVVPLGRDEILVSCEVFFVSPMSNLLHYMTLIHYHSRSEEGVLV